MSDKPILFSAPMVRAILAGQKTVTRRILKDAPAGEGWHCDRTATGLRWVANAGAPSMPVRLRWVPGDRLWVRETLTARPMANFLTGEPTNAIVAAYAADDEDVVESAGFNLCPRWKGGEDKRQSLPAIHMPRWASRITLSVTAVRVERLQDITEADAIAEGLFQQEGDGGAPGSGYKWTGTGYHGGTLDRHGGPCFHFPSPNGQCACRVGGPSPAQCAYADLWDHINGPGAWDANPFVVAVTFRREIANG